MSARRSGRPCRRARPKAAAKARGPAPSRGPRRSASRRRCARSPFRRRRAPPSPSASRPCWRRRVRGRTQGAAKPPAPEEAEAHADDAWRSPSGSLRRARRSAARPINLRAKNAGRRRTSTASRRSRRAARRFRCRRRARRKGADDDAGDKITDERRQLQRARQHAKRGRSQRPRRWW